jgi:guanylate kinase
VAEEELAAQSEFAHVIVNDDLHQAQRELVALVQQALACSEPLD